MPSLRPNEPHHRPRLGLCSVTLRADDPATVIARAAEAGLESIEWGSDVHVKAGDLDRARDIGRMTRDAGLTVCSYGSYLRFPWARGEPEDAATILETAAALGAPRVRVWAGPMGSAEAEPETRRRTTAALAQTAALAATREIEVAVEFHLGTLADTAASTLRLLRDLEPHTVSTYWQPRLGAADAEALDDLETLAEHISTLHVFSWGARLERFPLQQRTNLWTAAIASAVRLPKITDLLIEFLPEDDADRLAAEAAVLRSWLRAAVEEAIA